MLTLGLSPSRARLKIVMGMVVEPGPFKKAEITTSSKDSVKVSNHADAIACEQSDQLGRTDRGRGRPALGLLELRRDRHRGGRAVMRREIAAGERRCQQRDGEGAGFGHAPIIPCVAAAGGPVQSRIYPGLGHIGIVTAFAPLFSGRAPVLDDVWRFIMEQRPTG